MRIPEAAQELDFKGRKLVAGTLGRFERYVSWVWNGRRHLYVVGSIWSGRQNKRRYWFRRASWSLMNSLRGHYSPNVWYENGSSDDRGPGYYHRDECEFSYGPYATRHDAEDALAFYCRTML